MSPPGQQLRRCGRPPASPGAGPRPRQRPLPRSMGGLEGRALGPAGARDLRDGRPHHAPGLSHARRRRAGRGPDPEGTEGPGRRTRPARALLVRSGRTGRLKGGRASDSTGHLETNGQRSHLRRPFLFYGSPGRTRTCNLVVTRPPAFPRGLDYLFPIGPASALRGRALPPATLTAGVRPSGLVSARSPDPDRIGGFAQGYRVSKER